MHKHFAIENKIKTAHTHTQQNREQIVPNKWIRPYWMTETTNIEWILHARLFLLTTHTYNLVLLMKNWLARIGENKNKREQNGIKKSVFIYNWRCKCSDSSAGNYITSEIRKICLKIEIDCRLYYMHIDVRHVHANINYRNHFCHILPILQLVLPSWLPFGYRPQ